MASGRNAIAQARSDDECIQQYRIKGLTEKYGIGKSERVNVGLCRVGDANFEAMESVRVLRGSVEVAGRGVTWLLGVPHAPKTILSSVRCLQFDVKSDEPEYGVEAGKKTRVSICIYLYAILEIVEDFRVLLLGWSLGVPFIMLIFFISISIHLLCQKDLAKGKR